MVLNIIPDVHGEHKWKELVDLSADKIVFLGDYVDSFDVQNSDMIENLKSIIDFKLNNNEKVVLLFGNHDLQYLYLSDSSFRCSGLRPEIAIDLYEIFNKNKELFQYAYQVDNWIMTHAGIQNHWFSDVFKGDINKNIAEQINNPNDRKQMDALHVVGYTRGGWNDVGGIVWCDRSELKKPLKGFNQIVGHSRVKNVQEYKYHDNIVYFCDCLETLEKPLIIKI